MWRFLVDAWDRQVEAAKKIQVSGMKVSPGHIYRDMVLQRSSGFQAIGYSVANITVLCVILLHRLPSVHSRRGTQNDSSRARRRMSSPGAGHRKGMTAVVSVRVLPNHSKQRRFALGAGTWTTRACRVHGAASAVPARSRQTRRARRHQTTTVKPRQLTRHRRCGSHPSSFRTQRGGHVRRQVPRRRLALAAAPARVS